MIAVQKLRLERLIALEISGFLKSPRLALMYSQIRGARRKKDGHIFSIWAGSRGVSEWSSSVAWRMTSRNLSSKRCSLEEINSV